MREKPQSTPEAEAKKYGRTAPDLGTPAKLLDGTTVMLEEKVPNYGGAGNPEVMRGRDGRLYVSLRIPGVVALLEDVDVPGQGLLQSVIDYSARAEPETRR